MGSMLIIGVFVALSFSVATALPLCPSGGAALTINVDNPTGAPQAIRFRGSVLTASCSGGKASFDQTVTCGAGASDCITVTGLGSGIWKHRISVGSQDQYQKSILVAADPTPNTLSWVVFRTALTVDRTDDVTSNPTPQCPSPPGLHTCTLREAMSAGDTAPAPLLVQFDPSVFSAGKPTVVQLTQSLDLPIAGYGMMVDGTDPTGNPTFRGDPFYRVVRLPSGSAVIFSNQLARLAGLFLQRPTLANGDSPGDVVIFLGNAAQQNLVVNCKVDGGGGRLTDKSVGQDCIQGIAGAGGSWAGANVVRNTELTGCADKAVKSTRLAYVQVQDSWIHNNIGGGLQATLSGNVEADHNLIERSGYNVTTQVFSNANGLSANGADGNDTPDIASVLNTDGNIIRYSSSRGISVQELSAATITNDFSCGATNLGLSGQNGIAIFNATASTAFATVRGTIAVYNGRNGATVDGESTADFGQAAPDAGNNAFTQNATNSRLGGHNFDNSSTQPNIPARANQRQHCYANPAQPGATCNGNLSLDISGSVNSGTPQAYRGSGTTLPIVIQSVWPTKGKAGDLVHIAGSGFNAIDGYPARGNCTSTVSQHNKCGSQILGTCVQYEASPGNWSNLAVQAVTPTEIVVLIPSALKCAQPVRIRVQRADYTGASVSATGLFCTNF
jgi:hypothetical protein